MVNSTKRKGQKRKANSPSSKPVKSLRRDFSSKFDEISIKEKKIQKVSNDDLSIEQQNLKENVAKRVLKAGEGSSKMLGVHVSAAGGLEQSIFNAISIGCRSFALFVRNQRTWNCPPLSDATVQRFKNALQKYEYPVDQILPHASYLINPGSSDPTKLEKSRSGMLDECERCEKLGIQLYNFHPGSAVEANSRKECIRTIAATINYIIQRTKSIILVIETMAGQGNTIGGTFEELREIIDLVSDKNRVGVCIDTCHIFAAGYDIRTKEAYEKTMSEFEKIIGFKYLRGVHLNDSRGILGSKLDRHENIGKGKLTIKAFRFFMEDPRFDGIPLVLETPECDYAEEMIRLYNSVSVK